jgi:hypothetical protein
MATTCTHGPNNLLNPNPTDVAEATLRTRTQNPCGMLRAKRSIVVADTVSPVTRRRVSQAPAWVPT